MERAQASLGQRSGIGDTGVERVRPRDEDRSENCHAEGRANLPLRRIDGRRPAGVFGRDIGVRRRLQRNERERHTDAPAEHDAAHPPQACVEADEDEARRRDRHREHAEEDQSSRPDAHVQPSDDLTRDDHADRLGERRQTRLQSTQAEELLEEQR